MRFISAVLIAAAVVLTAACGSRGDQAPAPVINPEFVNLTKEEIFERGEDLYSKKKWARARSNYAHVYENYPNDPLGRRSLLRIADTYFQQRDPVSLVEAQYKYRDFMNRYPGSESADYALLQIANVAFQQMERPDRDQTHTKEAVQKYREMMNAFPRSKHRPEAEEKLQKALDRLAKHEHLVARFYINRGMHEAALPRLNMIIDEYPNYSERDAAFYELGLALDALGRDGEARLYFERVVGEFPDSDYARKAKEKLGSPNA